MIKFEKDLLIQKSTTKTILGLLLTVIITLWIGSKYYTNEHLETFDLIYLVILFLIASLFIVEGRGIPLAKIFGRAFILINEEQVSLKKGVFTKEKKVLWSEIESIEYRPNYFIFTKKDNNLFKFRLKQFSGHLNQEILDSIKQIGKRKGLTVKRMNDFKQK